MQAYWPVFITASIIEAACYFLLPEDEFTIVICLKTVGTTGYWLSKRHDGKSVRL